MLIYNQKFKNYLFSPKKGLEKVYIYLPEKNNDKLLELYQVQQNNMLKQI